MHSAENSNRDILQSYRRNDSIMSTLGVIKQTGYVLNGQLKKKIAPCYLFATVTKKL